MRANEKIYALRTTPFHKNPQNKFPSMKEFVLAIKETRRMFPIENMIDPDEWYEKVSTEYITINDFNK